MTLRGSLTPLSKHNTLAHKPPCWWLLGKDTQRFKNNLVFSSIAGGWKLWRHQEFFCTYWLMEEDAGQQNLWETFRTFRAQEVNDDGRLKYLNNSWMDCCEMSCTHSQNPQEPDCSNLSDPLILIQRHRASDLSWPTTGDPDLLPESGRATRPQASCTDP